ncbi:hypothetical protein M011DRAFT_4987 [Sporormia fimetaria CBS 119925]|uniref:Uncharacterized protein n=1 Tax=Sporormia fimetaria CBS 119925 TaxID=1340428 RepID=A0A6A6VNN1_9PLEO|nr:hypothetical protein M011DRAFT_4987 [Sporormia fimetaria CBS 119925]
MSVHSALSFAISQGIFQCSCIHALWEHDAGLTASGVDNVDDAKTRDDMDVKVADAGGDAGPMVGVEPSGITEGKGDAEVKGPDVVGDVEEGKGNAEVKSPDVVGDVEDDKGDAEVNLV